MGGADKFHLCAQAANADVVFQEDPRDPQRLFMEDHCGALFASGLAARNCPSTGSQCY